MADQPKHGGAHFAEQRVLRYGADGTPEGGSREAAARGPIDAPPGAAPAAPPIDAVFVTHGMGEQLRYQATDGVVQGLKRLYPDRLQIEPQTIEIAGCPRLQRTEIQFPEGRKLHLYEAYWAPITSGHVGLKDVVVFLASAGWNSIWRRRFFRWMFGSLRAFPVSLTIPFQILLVLLAVASLLAINLIGLGVVVKREWNPYQMRDVMTMIGFFAWNAAAFVLLMGIARTVRLSSDRARAGSSARPARGRLALWRAATRYCSAAAYLALFSTLIVLTVSAGAAVWQVVQPPETVATESPGGAGPDARQSLWTALFAPDGEWRLRINELPYLRRPLAQGVVFLAAAAVLAAVRERTARRERRGGGRELPAAARFWLAGVVALAAIATICSLPLLVYHFLCRLVDILNLAGRSLDVDELAWEERRRNLVLMVPWTLVILVGFKVRSFLIDFVGDVAAYVSSHRLDRFAKIRDEIKELAAGVASTLYLVKDESGEPLYRKVAVFGHSLGSVIAYDTLNAMLVQEELHPDRQLDVLERTTLLVTSGCPLDKLAFVFATQSDKTDDTRERLAAGLQPLIREARFRQRLDWVNVHSPSDIISGPLGFYDPPETLASAKAVVNIEDREATTPLAAHGEYAEHALLYRLLDAWHRGDVAPLLAEVASE